MTVELEVKRDTESTVECPNDESKRTHQEGRNYGAYDKAPNYYLSEIAQVFPSGGHEDEAADFT